MQSRDRVEKDFIEPLRKLSGEKLLLTDYNSDTDPEDRRIYDIDLSFNEWISDYGSSMERHLSDVELWIRYISSKRSSRIIMRVSDFLVLEKSNIGNILQCLNEANGDEWVFTAYYSELDGPFTGRFGGKPTPENVVRLSVQFRNRMAPYEDISSYVDISADALSNLKSSLQSLWSNMI